MFISKGVQCLPHDPRGLMHVRDLGMLTTMPRVISHGIRLHSSCNARPSCCKLLQRKGLLRHRHHKTSHMCYMSSIGDMSSYLAERGKNNGNPDWHTGQCKSTGGCYNELVVAYFGTGGGVKWRKR